jgi:hypothetical protein
MNSKKGVKETLGAWNLVLGRYLKIPWDSLEKVGEGGEDDCQ